jgi:hypothetical protein
MFIRRTNVCATTKLSYEALNRHFWVGAVCALHEQSTTIRSFIKTSNMQIKDEKAKDREFNFFLEGENPLRAD